jgi:preprotein translocase SecE subunit
MSQKKSAKFFRNPKYELRQVTWPAQSVLVKSTFLIIILVIVVTTYITGLDYLLAGFMKWLETTL